MGDVKTIVIGIAGGTGSGKTTFTRHLQETLAEYSIELFHMDRYFKERPPVTVAPFSGREFEDHNHPDSFRMDDFCRDLEQARNSGCCQVILAEGLMVLHAQCVRDLLDLGIFIDTMADERIVRRLRRNMERGLDFEDISQFYLDSVRHRHNEFVEPSRWHADIVVNGHTFSERALKMLRLWVIDALQRP